MTADSTLEPDSRLHAEDLLEDPRLDSEALCLCGLLWSTPGAARRVVDLLEAGDFDRPAHAALFQLVADEVREGRPHDPASIAAALTHQGAQDPGGLMAKALAAATTAGAAPESTGHHAVTVATTAYRRSFHTAATALTQAAEQLPTDELFDHLVDIGRAQRTATQRLQHLRSTLATSRTV
jgi:replicative DNA helicase